MIRLYCAYLAGSASLLGIWLIFFFVRKDLRWEMWTMSLLVSSLSVATSYYWWTVDWWKPPTITHTIVGVEDLVMGFASGGIMATAYKVLFRRRPHPEQALCLDQPKPYFPLIVLALVTAFLFWLLGLTSFWASTIALIATAALLFSLRPDLLLIGVSSGVLMAVISLSFYFTILWVSPGWVAHTYQFKTLSKVLVLGIPIEDFVFWFLAGLVMGPFYDYWHGEQSSKVPPRYSEYIRASTA